MEVRGFIIGSVWLAIMVTAATYIWIGKITWATDIAVGLLFSVGLIMTIILAFGLEYFQTMMMDKERPSTKELTQISKELTEMRSMVVELTKKVDAIQKELQE
jgi:membrane protein implicated in regulation of membrane protease activity